MAKHLIVCGGVISGCGKGVAAASMGLLMKLRGHKVQIIKLDPYLNTSAGVLAPREHGECFVCDDGSEVDLDLGHYERIAGNSVSAQNICTSGVLFEELLREQKTGKWMGQTIQYVPHLTDKVQERLIDIGKDVDVVVTEIGGTVGDLESVHFYEAIRQFKQKYADDVLIAMVAPILWVETIKEFKTKPLQSSVKDLQRYGLPSPDVLLCRVDRPVPSKILDKISTMVSVPRDQIFDAPDVGSIYDVPLEFYNRQLDDLIVDKLRLKRNPCRIHKYRELGEKRKSLTEVVRIGVFGKYTNNSAEAYMSLKEAISHAGLPNDVRAEIDWIDVIAIEQNPELLKNLNIDAAIVPGGFDNRGIEGKIETIRHCRENKIPFLGICLGLQCSVIEFARNVCGLKYANSQEFDIKTPDPVVHFVEGQKDIQEKCGTMRLGAYDCELSKGSLALEVYAKKVINERHRHRYEVNAKYENILKEKGFLVSGRNPESGLIEIMELDRQIHPFFIGTQAHPEFKSRVEKPAVLFSGLIGAAVKYHNGRQL